MIKHLGFILDGNRRYAKKHDLMQGEGHKKGAEKVKDIIGWSKEYSIQELTLYTFSTENFSRTEDEKELLFNRFREAISELKDNDTEILVKFVGKLEMFPEDMQKMMHDAMEKTKGNKGIKVNFAVAYGGRQEIVDSVKKALSKGLEIDENAIMDNLYINSEPDLIIRTGGSLRCSNFLMYQSAYTEWHFSDKLLPEFEKEDFDKAMSDFSQRTRNFGK